jgi:hypothetical protein
VKRVYDIPPERRDIDGRKFRQKCGAKSGGVEACERGGHGARVFKPCAANHHTEVIARKKRWPPPSVSRLTRAPVARETTEQFGAIGKKHCVRVRRNKTARRPRGIH